jgi:putative FmdB family regulatory protein
MPSYVYRCEDCGFEMERHFYPVEYRNNLPTCITCGTKMPLVVNAPSLRFNGDGWQTKKAVKEGEK